MNTFKKYIIKFFSVLIFLGFLTPVFSQNIDSLKQVAKELKGGEKIQKLLTIARSTMKTSKEEGLKYVEEAVSYSKQLPDSMYVMALVNAAKSTFRYMPKESEKYVNQTIAFISEKDDPALVILTKHKLSSYFLNINKLDESIRQAEDALVLLNETSMPEVKSKLFYNLVMVYYRKGEYETALSFLEKELEVNLQANFQDETANVYTRMGVISKNLGNYDKATEYYQKALKIYESLEVKDGMAHTYTNIGNVYFYFTKNYKKSIDYYQQALTIFEEIEDVEGMSRIYLNIGLVYVEWGSYNKAVNFIEKSLEINKKLENEKLIAESYNHLSVVYAEQEKYSLALSYAEKALSLNKKIKNSKTVSHSYEAIGEIYNKWGKYYEAIKYYNLSIEMIKKMGLEKESMGVYRDVSEVYAKLGNYQKSLDYFKTYSDVKDSTFNKESLQQINELEEKYKSHKKQKEIELLNKDKALNEAEIRKQELFLYGLGGIIILIIGFSVVVLKQYRDKQKANVKLEKQNIEITEKSNEIKKQHDEIAIRNVEITQAKEEIEAQRDEIEAQRDFVMTQRDEIQHKNKNIQASIHYASRIQTAILPKTNIIESESIEHFILNKPRDIVSGDYYWFAKKDNKLVVTAADCTGHGVPGAFMSMLGVSFLSQIVNQQGVLEADEILNRMKARIIDALHQTGKAGEAQDGMDMALCVLDIQNNKLQYAGANNPLFLIRNGELTHYKADKMPIGIYGKKNQPFERHEIEMQKGDLIYIFSDGYVDQFGGPKRRKFLTKRFKNLLLEITEKPMNEQKEILNQTIEAWKGSQGQLDDILVIGLRI